MSSGVSNPTKRSADVAECAFQRLVESILEGKLVGGRPLREAALARAWNVSRTPLREAVRRASELGLVVLRPNQKPLVRLFELEDMRALYALRELLELHALRTAWPALLGHPCETMMAAARKVAVHRSGWRERCLEFDAALHQWWTGQCGNAWLTADFARHYQLLRVFQRWGGRDAPALVRSYQEHLAILKAIENRDRKAAVVALRDHIRRSAQVIEAAVCNAD
jgi:GntR family transcriptional regulator, rspAB operon transcriptional repressor